jgi:hypothetical protein
VVRGRTYLSLIGIWLAAHLSPSGLTNRYGPIPFAFPAAIELEGLSALSDALVCRHHHDKYAVVCSQMFGRGASPAVVFAGLVIQWAEEIALRA